MEWASGGGKVGVETFRGGEWGWAVYRLGFGDLSEAFADEIPVDDILEGFEVIGSAILVFEVIGVLPDIETEDGDSAGGVGAILIGEGFDGEFLVFINQPSPATSEDFEGGGGIVFLKFGEASEGGVDGFG